MKSELEKTRDKFVGSKSTEELTKRTESPHTEEAAIPSVPRSSNISQLDLPTMFRGNRNSVAENILKSRAQSEADWNEIKADMSAFFKKVLSRIETHCRDAHENGPFGTMSHKQTARPMSVDKLLGKSGKPTPDENRDALLSSLRESRENHEKVRAILVEGFEAIEEGIRSLFEESSDTTSFQEKK